MAMVCAQCGQTFHGQERKCPKCDLLLLHQQHGVQQPDDTMPPSDPRNRWQQTPWGRIVVSVLIAQGFAYCFQQMYTAWFVAGGEAASWYTPTGILWLNAFNIVPLFVAAILAGANQERGATSGGLVGLWSGLIFIGIHRAAWGVLDPVTFFAQPFVHMAVGLVGGLVGNRIWQPVPIYSLKEDVGTSGMLPRPARKLFKGPIQVVRILIGAAIAVAGAVFARQVLEEVLRQGQGTFRISSDSKWIERMIVYQIIGLAALIGGVVAGSSSRNGFKQGLFAGVLSAALFLSVQLANSKSLLEVTLFTTTGVLAMSIIGGMFGSTLFPPLAKEKQKVIPY